MSDTTSQENKMRILRNRRKIFELENQVDINTTNIMVTRSAIEENRAALARNYAAAFGGNRILTTRNSSDLYRNRQLLIEALEDDTTVAQNFKRMKTNSAKLDHIEFQAELNRRMLAVNVKMVEINDLYLEVNSMVSTSNQLIVDHNASLIDENAQLIDGGLIEELAQATTESNAEAISKNSERLGASSELAEDNAKTIEALLKRASQNASKINQAGDDVLSRRRKMLQNREKVVANQKRAANYLIAQ